MTYQIKTANESSIIGLSGLDYNTSYQLDFVVGAIHKHSSEYHTTQDKIINKLIDISPRFVIFIEAHENNSGVLLGIND